MTAKTLLALGFIMITQSCFGFEWYQRTLLTTNEYHSSCAFGNGKYIMTGRYGVFWHSSDNVSWTPSSAPTNEFFSQIRYLKGTFVAITRDFPSKIYTSTSGTNWTLKLNTGATSLFDIEESPDGTVVVVGGTVNTNTSTRFFPVSEDLNTWTEAPLPSSATSGFNSVTYGNGAFHALGRDGDIYKSTNGYDWVYVHDLIDNGYGFNIEYGEDRFVATGNNRSFVSLDGEDWVEVSGGPFGYVGYAESRFVVVNLLGAVSESIDGVTWSPAQNLSTNTATIYDLNYCDNGFVTCGYPDKTYVSTSTPLPPVPLGTDLAMEINWGSASNVFYQVQYSTDSNIWFNLGSPYLGDGTTQRVPVVISQDPDKLYRVILK